MDNIGIDGSPIFEGHLDFIEIYIADKLGYGEYASTAKELYAQHPGYIMICDELKKLKHTDSYKYMLDRFGDKGEGGGDDGSEIIYRDPSSLKYFHYEKLNDDEKLLYSPKIVPVWSSSKRPPACPLYRSFLSIRTPVEE